MEATHCWTTEGSHFASRFSLPRRMLLAGATSWSLSVNACATYQPRFTPPSPAERYALGGRDSLSRAYNLGLDDGNAAYNGPRSSAPAVGLLAGAVGATAAARATRNVMVLVYAELAGGGAVAAGTAVRSGRPLPSPPDSVASMYGFKSPQMWDRYLAGFHDAAEIHHHAATKAGYVSAGVMVLLAGLTYLIIQFTRNLSRILY